MSDVRLAVRATGLLRELNEGGVLHAADVHVAQRLGALAGEADERVLLALALAVRGVRNGSVVLALSEVPATVGPDDAEGEAPSRFLPTWPAHHDWLKAVQASPLAGGPLHVEGDRLWLDRYWRQEVLVASTLLDRAADPPVVDAAVLAASLARLWPGSDPEDQRFAAAVCALSRVSVLGGGPGTGKTTTVARLLVALRDVDGPARVALAAPTGKAAARLLEAVTSASAGLTPAEQAYLGAMTSSTLHRLLGVRRGSARFWHHAGNRLPHDVVVVDESSMVSLTMFARLLAALRPSARLVLVGDPDQLASVEAGAVLSDLVAPAVAGLRTGAFAAALSLAVPQDPVDSSAPDTPAARVRDGVALLRRIRRYDEGGAIASLAAAIRAGDAPAALAVLRSGQPGVRFEEVADEAPVTSPALRKAVVEQARQVLGHAGAGEAAEALRALEAHRLLCAHRRGLRGVSHWSQVVQGWLVHDLGIAPRRDGRYVGLPLLVTANDYDNGLWNGDTGVIVQDGQDSAAWVAAFGTGGPDPKVVPLGRLAEVQPLYAMTVHRGQGSQFEAVTVLLPPATSPLGTRETLYTAVTRAMNEVRVIGSAAAVEAAVRRPVLRASGLQARLS